MAATQRQRGQPSAKHRRRNSRSPSSNPPAGAAAAAAAAEAAAAISTEVTPSELSLWLSSNPEKAWAEWFFLRYSLVWPLLFGGWCASGLHLLVGDAGNLLVTVAIGSPNVLGPLFLSPTALAPANADGNGSDVTPRLRERYWFKFNLWIAVFTFVASYFWTEYFFDVLKMNYNFPHLRLNLDAVLLGSGRQRVPLMMYFHAHYFFITYHTASIVTIRRARRTTRWLKARVRLAGSTDPTTATANDTRDSSAAGSTRLRRLIETKIIWLAELALTVLPYVGTAWLFAWLEIYATSESSKSEHTLHASSVCLSVCLSACLPARLPACLSSVCLHVCLSVCGMHSTVVPRHRRGMVVNLLRFTLYTMRFPLIGNNRPRLGVNSL